MELLEETNYNLTTRDNYRYQMVPVPPGLLQYYVKKHAIINLNIAEQKESNIDYKEGYELECHTKENFLRLSCHCHWNSQ